MHDQPRGDSVSRINLPGPPVFRVEGRLDRSAAACVEAAVHSAVEQGHRCVGLDLGPTERVDTAAVAVLVGLNERMRAGRRELRIVDASLAVCTVLAARGLGFMLPERAMADYPTAC